MKVLTFSKFSLLCGLALGIMVLWAGASPIAEGGGLLIGGWYPETEGYCCSHDFVSQCKGFSGCDPNDTTPIDVCVQNDNGPGIAWGNDTTPCEIGEPACTECEECECDGGNP